MRKGYIVSMPPGAGKSRFVLEKIHKLSKGKFENAINNTLIIAPSQRVRKVWLRETVLYLENTKSKRKIEDVKKLSANKLKKRLKIDYNITLDFATYRKLNKRKNKAFLVLDEWHRFNLYDDARNYIENDGTAHRPLSRKTIGRYGSHTFFVSATPLNPVLEGEVDDEEKEHADYDDAITQSRQKALYTIAYLLDAKRTLRTEELSNEKLIYAKAITKMGVKVLHKNTKWKPPGGRIKQESEYHSMTDILTRLKAVNEDESNWKSEEYAWAVGLVRTSTGKKEKYKIQTNRLGKPTKSFGFPYSTVHIPESVGNVKDAGRWLNDKHPRIKRLLEILVAEGVLDKKNQFTQKKKALIFCIHQGVAKGLNYALSQIVKSKQITHNKSSSNTIMCSVDELSEQDEVLFNKKDSKPFILIATDKMSESIDLHEACEVVIHYELPWSPLRLLQRVGRLTRRSSSGEFGKTYVYHVIIPGSVEEERVNRLLRRTELLAIEGAWPKELHEGTKENYKKIARSIIGAGPSLHLREILLQKNI